MYLADISLESLIFNKKYQKSFNSSRAQKKMYLKTICYVLLLCVESTGASGFSKIRKHENTTVDLWSSEKVHADSIVRCMHKCYQATTCKNLVSFSKNGTECLIHTPKIANDANIVVLKYSDDFDVYTTLFQDAIEMVSDDGKRLVIDDSLSQISVRPKTNTPVMVQGASSWLLYSRSNFNGKQYLVKPGYGTFNDFFGFKDSNISSVKKLEDCTVQPIGVQNQAIIPDNIFEHEGAMNNNPWAFESRLMSVDAYEYGYSAGFDFDNPVSAGYTSLADGTQCITVDLGGLYRIYAIETQGALYINAEGVMSEPYRTHTYKLYYKQTTKVDETFQVYKDATGAEKTFSGNGGNYREVLKKTLEIPFLARSVKICLITAYYYGMRFEYYGCKVEDAYTESRGFEMLESSTGTKMESLTECEETCRDQSFCTGFVHTKNSFHMKHCYLVDDCSLPFDLKYITSYTKPGYHRLLMKECNGNIIGSYDVLTLQQCIDYCDGVSSCNGIKISNGYMHVCNFTNAASVTLTPSDEHSFVKIIRSDSSRLSDIPMATTDAGDNLPLAFKSNTCVDFASNTISSMRFPVPLNITSRAVQLELISSCTDILAYTNKSPDYDLGFYMACSSQFVPNRHTFNCVCQYGLCEYVYIRFISPCAILCDVRFS